MKKCFWNKYNDKYKKYFQNWFIDKKKEISIGDIYGAYYWQNMQEEIDATTLEKYTSPQNREKFLTYLSCLLCSGELKMKTFEYIEKENSNGYEGKSFHFYGGKEWKQEEVEEGIKYVREKWNSIERERERSAFEDLGVAFTLSENEWMM